MWSHMQWERSGDFVVRRTIRSYDLSTSDGRRKYEWDTRRRLSYGTHGSIRMRSYDGNEYLEPVQVELVCRAPAPAPTPPTPTPVAGAAGSSARQ